MKGAIRNGLYLWIEKSSDCDNLELLIQQLNNCNRAVDRFLEGKISVNNYLEYLAANQVAIDAYLDTVENNLKLLL